MPAAENKLRNFGAHIGLILGSGLSPLVDHFETDFRLPYSDFPEFPEPGVHGHEGFFHAVHCDGIRLLIASGRVHLYEGWEAREVVRGVQALHHAGVKVLLLTNAAGAVNPGAPPGTWMMIRDHINLTGQSPLRGSPRFIDMTEVYSKRLRSHFQRAARTLGQNLPEGVYAAMPGPQYETPAEINMLRVLGADAVGMSTVPEAIQARALDMEVGAFSCITNLAAGLSKNPLSHEDVLATGRDGILRFSNLLKTTLPSL